MKTSFGFTIVELLVAIVFFAVVGTIFFDRYQTVQMVHRDQDRKVAINAIHYNLEEVVRPTLNGYPYTLSAAQLRAMDPALLKDPEGILIGAPSSDYRYEPTGCNGGDICTGYTLRADLEQENNFIKKSLKN